MNSLNSNKGKLLLFSNLIFLIFVWVVVVTPLLWKVASHIELASFDQLFWVLLSGNFLTFGVIAMFQISSSVNSDNKISGFRVIAVNFVFFVGYLIVQSPYVLPA